MLTSLMYTDGLKAYLRKIDDHSARTPLWSMTVPYLLCGGIIAVGECEMY